MTTYKDVSMLLRIWATRRNPARGLHNPFNDAEFG